MFDIFLKKTLSEFFFSSNFFVFMGGVFAPLPRTPTESAPPDPSCFCIEGSSRNRLVSTVNQKWTLPGFSKKFLTFKKKTQKENCLYTFILFVLKSSETYGKKFLWSALFEGRVEFFFKCYTNHFIFQNSKIYFEHTFQMISKRFFLIC